MGLRLAAALACLVAGLGDREDGQGGGHAPAPPLPLPSSAADDAASGAVQRGLAFLASQQALRPDGSLPGGKGEDAAPVGVTALATLAFMAGGSTPGRGPFGDEVGLAVDYLLSRVTAVGHEHDGYITDSSDRRSQTHGHGLATLALAEAYTLSPGTVRGRRIGDALKRAVRRIEVSQGAEGGWYYDPERSVEHEGSVTVCLVQGLRAAHDAGVFVDTKVIARAIDYVQRLQNPDGGFRYGLHEDRTSVALTAACLSTLHATGIYEGTAISNGYDYVWRELAARDGGMLEKRAAFHWYERFYLSQTLWQHPDQDLFPRWFEAEREEVLRSQREDGSWNDRRFDRSYATAMACLMLSLPDGLLPIFQR